MIDAEGLRLNNLVMCKVSNDAGIYRVTAIGGWERTYDKKDKEKNNPKDERIIFIDRCTTKVNGEPFCESKIKPIPLTEEWLIKLGFQYDTITYYQQDYTGILIADGDDDEFDLFFGSIKNRIFVGIKYVHQLQNLYFALTDKELTIKPL
jgi:hypothetical protein